MSGCLAWQARIRQTKPGCQSQVVKFWEVWITHFLQKKNVEKLWNIWKEISTGILESRCFICDVLRRPFRRAASQIAHSKVKSACSWAHGDWEGHCCQQSKTFLRFLRTSLYSVHQLVCRRSHIHKTRCNMYLPVPRPIKQQTQLSRSSDHLGKGFKPLSEI